MFEKEQLRFTAIYWIPIIATFIIALTTSKSVFMLYNVVMPSTLAVLCSHDYGATLFKDVQRLMGVTFGNVLPLLAMSVLQLFDCDTYARIFCHAAMISATSSVSTSCTTPRTSGAPSVA